MSDTPPQPTESSPQHSAITTPKMATETQTAPNIPPPAFLNFNSRRLPQPIQLPSISASLASPAPEYATPSTPPMSSAHHGPSASTQSQPRSQPRSYATSSAPIDKILSPHPSSYTSRADSYSPQHSPNISQLNDRYRPSPPPHYPRDILQRHSSEDSRQTQSDYTYASPSERQRPVFPSIPPQGAGYSPPLVHQPQFQPPLHVPSHHMSSSAQPLLYHTSNYSESLSHGAPPRLMPGTAPAPITAQDPEKNLRYELKIRQQPIAARACGFGERDRRVIDPPPIIQLVVTDAVTNNVVDLDELRYSLNVVHCTLWNADGTGEETALVQPDRRTTRRLMGQLVASPSVAKDEHDKEGCFFCFPDLSCRTHGRYRLRFVLMRIDQKNLRVGGSSPILTEVLSDVFQVYTAKDFPGMRPSSALTRALKLQGCNIQVKKGNEKALARKRLQASSEEAEAEANKKQRVD